MPDPRMLVTLQATRELCLARGADANTTKRMLQIAEESFNMSGKETAMRVVTEWLDQVGLPPAATTEG